ncbi:zinc finger MYND domain-containing protein [Aspergillus mulundensis]|uniref:MYND-type domain-containing protein n=1 Tax=Aspergillus mulundensis TaxID=1810919 RepID=A0A3D8SDB1_9EURO|nr:hypothetical protein DSM5745_04487 [Aspergillus mulundensis]RDW84161.1 hypothetical protein DSM5745_04487 [Aspergillus mulundensis]
MTSFPEDDSDAARKGAELLSKFKNISLGGPTPGREHYLDTSSGITAVEPRSIEDSEEACLMCNATPVQRCARCKSASYCSKTCQKNDYRAHKLLCQQFANQSPRPSAQHVRGIFFPVNAEKPEVVWIPCALVRRPDEEPCQELDPMPFLHDIPGWDRIQVNHVRRRQLGVGLASYHPEPAGYCVALFYRDNFLSDGSVPNKSFQASLATSGARNSSYRGPLLAVRQLPPKDLEQDDLWRDVMLSDFRHIIDHFHPSVVGAV